MLDARNQQGRKAIDRSKSGSVQNKVQNKGQHLKINLKKVIFLSLGGVD